MNTALFMRQNPSMPILQARRRLDMENTTVSVNRSAATTHSTATSASQPSLTFMDLPAEIRIAIWRAATPRRVVDFWELSDSVKRIDGRMPQPLASLCYESRETVLQSGRWTLAAGGRSVWLGLHDTLLLNLPEYSEYSNPIGYLDEAVRCGSTIAVAFDLLRPTRTSRALFPLFERLQTVQQTKTETNKETLVYFDEIVVTGTRAQAFASGLFDGTSSPGERFAFVKLSDQATLRQLLSESEAGLAIGSRGFLRELLLPSHSMSNMMLLAAAYLRYKRPQNLLLSELRMIGHEFRRTPLAEHRGELEEGTLLSMALDEGMPSLEQAVLIRFEEKT